MDPKTYWDEKHAKYAQQEWIHKPTIFATQVISFFPPSGRILELGCGQGQDTKYFLDHGYQLVACDFSPDALKLATQQIPGELTSKVELKTLDMSVPMPFEKASFDVVYSHLALHYFNRQRTQQLFDEIFHILKPGGIFATLTNTIQDPEVSSATPIEEGFYESGGIQKRYFSVETMARFASKFETLLLDANGETHKDEIKTLIRFVGKKL